MSASQSGVYNLQAFLDSGALMANGRLYTYAYGTTTQKTAYTDHAATTPHTYTSDGLGGQYIALNARGELPAPLYLAQGSYDLSLKNSDGSTEWTRRADPVFDITNDLSGSGGAALLGYLPSGTAGISTTVALKLDQYDTSYDTLSTAQKADVSANTGAVDVTAALNSKLADGGHIIVLPGTYNVSTLNMSVDGTTLHLCSGAKIKPSSVTVKAINVTGANCAITGMGSIDSPATFDATNARRTFATIWVAGHGFKARDFTLNNVPRCGIHFEDATQWSVSNVTIKGNIPQSVFVSSGATATGHIGIEYNPPTDGTFTGLPSGIVSGCTISGCVQGVTMGNYDSAGTATGFVLTGNSFYDIWDHAYYDALGIGPIVTNNNFNNCHNPLVINGTGAIVTGNTSYSTDSSQIVAYSIRDCSYANISNNTIYGPGAAIDMQCITGTVMSNNIVSNNIIHRTALGSSVSGSMSSAIRMGSAAQVCENNTISFNKCSGTGYNTIVGVIQCETAATYFAKNTQLIGNDVTTNDVCFGIQATNHNQIKVRGGSVNFAGNYVSGVSTASCIYLGDCADLEVDGVECNYRTGGTGVTIRGIQTAGSPTGTVRNNRFSLSSGSLTAVDEIGFVQPSVSQYKNQIKEAAKMDGTFTFNAAASSATIANTNILTTSRIVITATNAAGAAILGTGVYMTYVAGTATVTLSTGTAAGSGTFVYEIM